MERIRMIKMTLPSGIRMYTIAQRKMGRLSPERTDMIDWRIMKKSVPATIAVT
jgi:hypothetical protein